MGLLTEIGRVYEPYLIANAAAKAERQSQFHCVIDGVDWTQNTFVYQAKCLQWIREEFAALDSESQTQIVALAIECGFHRLLAIPS
jgi:predicted peroxiredoxin